MFKGYRIKYVTYGLGNDGPKMYGILMIKSDRGWVVEVWPCDAYGAQVSDPIEFTFTHRQINSIFNELYYSINIFFFQSGHFLLC